MLNLPDPDAFLYLPESLVEELGITTHQGARLEAAILAGFAYYYKLNKNHESVVRFSGGALVTIPKGKFVVSLQKIALNLYFRWFLKLPSEADPLQDESFNRFYERCRASAKRLRSKGYIHFSGWAVPSKKGKQGSIWSLDGTPLEKLIHLCRESPCQGILITQVKTAHNKDGFVSAVDLVGGVLSNESHTPYVYGEVCCGAYERGVFHPQLEWVRLVAKNGAAGSRLTTSSTFKKSDLRDIDSLADQPSVKPWIIIDVDDKQEGYLGSFDPTYNLLKELDGIGVDLDLVIAAFTGGGGYHVQIPSGMFGNPVFRDSESSIRLLSHWTRHNVTEDFDPALFKSRQIYRMIGSKRPNGRFKLAMTGREFLSSNVYDIVNRSTEFRSFEVPDPFKVEPNVALIDSLIESSAIAAISPISNKDYVSIDDPVPSFDRVPAFDPENLTSGIVQRAMKPISEGELWCEEKGHVGRDIAMFILACYFIRKYNGDERATFLEMSEINQSYNPPLRDRVLREKIRSATSSLRRNSR